MKCGGEKPFKLVQPSSDSSVSYSELIVDMKKLLAHTHFAVNSKAMEVLQMLSEGVGEKIFANIRPLLLQLTNLSKDKKLTQAVGSCLDSLFGKVLSFDHLLEMEDAIPDAVHEKKQKNALARKSSMEFLFRCIERNESAGPRGTLKSTSAERIAVLASEKLDDTDASVRKISLELLQLLLANDNAKILEKVKKVVKTLESKNARAFKSLSKHFNQKGDSEQSLRASTPKASVKSTSMKASSTDSTSTDRPSLTGSYQRKQTEKKTVSSSAPKNLSPSQNNHEPLKDDVDNETPSLDDAINALSLLSIPAWDLPEDDGGVLAGLQCKSMGATSD